MDEAVQSTAVDTSAATSTYEVDGITINVNNQARGSWDAVFMLRDINKLKKRYNDLPAGMDKNEIIGDVLAIMLEYVCFVSDLSREKISAHLGKYASVADVSNYVADVFGTITSKN